MSFMKMMKEIRLACLAVVLLTFAHGVSFGAEESVEEMLKRPPKAPVFNTRDLDLNRKVVDFLAQYHYTPSKIDAQRSSQWFNEYFRSLDYTRMYFLESDIEDFRSFETILGDESASAC